MEPFIDPELEPVDPHLKPFVDLHCHPSFKPFGLACPGNINSADPSLVNSIWYDDPPSYKAIRWNKNHGITKFSQANFTSLFKGNFKVIIGALSPAEKGFFPYTHIRWNPDHGRSFKRFIFGWTSFLGEFTTGIGKKKVDFIQYNKDDFNELNCEYEFYKQLDNKQFTIYGEKVRYRLTNNYDDIYRNLNSQNKVLSVVLSIEGGNLFSNDNSSRQNPESVLKNVDAVKSWQHPPFFVTLCHHFYNYLGGQARSLPRPINKLLDDKTGSDEDLTGLGKKVIHRLLSQTNGRRIYIDIKHMSRKARTSYYRILESRDYRNEDIPIIVSHGACNGYPKLEIDGTPNERHGLFNGRDINFYDDEIVRIAKSGGIFGLQIDKRQLTNILENNKIKRFCSRRKKLERWTGLVWNQIQHIADVLDSNNLPAWNITSLGTDFDGITSPPEWFWTSRELPHLYKHLQNYASIYLGSHSFRVQANHDDFTPKKIMVKIFSKNALAFLEKYYH
jgi:microsomal dipeptidase-like Zn-dependent dipeptidase